jgi:hypothetical protein
MWAADSNSMVPLAAIPGEEYGAYTLRRRIQRLLPDRLRAVPEPSVREDSLGVRLDVPGTRVTSGTIDRLIAACAIDHTVPPSPIYHGGYQRRPRGASRPSSPGA